MPDVTPTYADQLLIEPLHDAPRAAVRVPGSKSITNRALVLAALASQESECNLHGALQSEDTELMIGGLTAFGFQVWPDWPTGLIHVRPLAEGAEILPESRASIFVGNSGTTMRFLTAVAALGRGRYRLDGVSRMRERPIEDLLAALRQLGVKAQSERGNGLPPVCIESNGLGGGEVRVRGDISSQFLSGLLMIAPYAQADEVVLKVEGALVSRPYADMTLTMMRQFGAIVKEEPTGEFHIPGGQCYRALRRVEGDAPGVYHFRNGVYDIEPDASAASYFFAAAAITGGSVTVAGRFGTSMQGDVRFLDALERMGCTIMYNVTDVTVTGGPLHGIDIDMNDISDTVMTLAAVACFAEGPTTIRNVAHIRHKETDRLAALATELRRLGAVVEERADGLTIVPALLHGAVVQTYDDHRMAMSLALVGLKVPGVVVDHPACVAKTYPHFFRDLEALHSQHSSSFPETAP
jgi:3-phosphoshikimate 1-carboxyvinyltransferase